MRCAHTHRVSSDDRSLTEYGCRRARLHGRYSSYNGLDTPSSAEITNRQSSYDYSISTARSENRGNDAKYCVAMDRRCHIPDFAAAPRSQDRVHDPDLAC